MERYLELEIPTSEEVDYLPKIISPQELLLVKSYPCSYEGNIISIAYTLKVFVKHEGWNSFGEGNCVLIPVRIMQAPHKVEFAMPKVQAPP